MNKIVGPCDLRILEHYRIGPFSNLQAQSPFQPSLGN